MTLIALNGLIGSGKSTVARILRQQYDFESLKFAGPLKAMLRSFYHACGMDEAVIERKVEGDLKEVPCTYLAGKTPRWAMQSLGTEWGRNCIGKDFWVMAMAQAIKSLGHDRIVIDDCRFPNEAKLVKDLGGEVWRIRRPVAIMTAHPSEFDQLNVQPDRVLENDGTLADLSYLVGAAVEHLALSTVPQI